MPSSTLPPDGLPPRPRCARFIEGRGRQCRARAEAGDLWCRFHGGKAPSHEGKKQERIGDYQDQLMELADAALDTIQEKLLSKNHAVALRAALEVLDRTGVVTTRKSETNTTITQKSELDDRIDKLLGEMTSGRAASPDPDEDEEAPLPAPSSRVTASSSDAPGPPDRLGMPEGFDGGGHGLGLSGSGEGDDDEGRHVP